MKCPFCEARLHIERAWGDAGRAKGLGWTINTCQCLERKNFIAYGVVPATKGEAKKFITALRKELGLTQTRGPKEKPITLLDLRRELNKLSPHAPLAHLADALGVSPRKAQQLVKEKLYRTFDEIQTERRGGESRLRPPRRRQRLKS